MGGCGECLAKFGLISFNIIFMLSGIAVLGVGIWVKVDKNVVKMQDLIQFDSSDKNLSNAAWTLIGFGSFVLIVSAFGFLAACKQNKFFIGGCQQSWIARRNEGPSPAIYYLPWMINSEVFQFFNRITSAIFCEIDLGDNMGRK